MSGSHSTAQPIHSDSSVLVPLERPTVPDALPLLSDEKSYLIPLAYQAQNLKVVIENVWPINHAGETARTQVDVLWDNLVVSTTFIQGPYDPDVVFPFTVYVPAHELDSPGVHRLAYRADPPAAVPEDSHLILVNIDKLAPNQGNPAPDLVFEGGLGDVPLTEEYLAEHGGAVARIPTWPDMRLEDRVSYFWASGGAVADTNAQPAGVLEIGPEHQSLPYIELVYSETLIRASGNGFYLASCYLTDRAGNQGRSNPNPVWIEVALDDSPLILPDPQVKAAEDGLIDLEDARAGVVVEVPHILRALPGNVVRVLWNTRLVEEITIIAGQTWPLKAPVDWANLSMDGLYARDPVRVYYTLKRGVLPALSSGPLFFDIDLTLAGPVGPEAPDPVNSLLEKVTVKGVTGDNILTGADEGEWVQVVVPLFTNPQKDEVLELYWGDHPDNPVATYAVKDGDVAGQTVSFSVLWQVIEDVGNGPAVPVYYWTFNGVNRQRAAATPVNVNVDIIKNLKRVEFPDMEEEEKEHAIRCIHKPWNGIRVRVPGQPAFGEGDTITVTWQGHSTPNGGGPPITGTIATFTHTLTGDEAVNGYIFTVLPFDPLITVPALSNGTSYGSARVRYRLKKLNGVPGRSLDNAVGIDLKRPGRPPCLGDD